MYMIPYVYVSICIYGKKKTCVTHGDPGDGRPAHELCSFQKSMSKSHGLVQIHTSVGLGKPGNPHPLSSQRVHRVGERYQQSTVYPKRGWNCMKIVWDFEHTIHTIWYELIIWYMIYHADYMRISRTPTMTCSMEPEESPKELVPIRSEFTEWGVSFFWYLTANSPNPHAFMDHQPSSERKNAKKERQHMACVSSCVQTQWIPVVGS